MCLDYFLSNANDTSRVLRLLVATESVQFTVSCAAAKCGTWIPFNYFESTP